MTAGYKSFWLIWLILLMAGCASGTTPKDNLTQCNEPRSQACTMDYNPVCGLREDDTVGPYSNACTACSDPNVTAWAPGECQKTGGRQW